MAEANTTPPVLSAAADQVTTTGKETHRKAVGDTIPRAAGNGKQVMLDFLRDLEKAPDDADLVIRVGRSPPEGPWLVVVSMCGKDTTFDLLGAETTASVMEVAMHRFPDVPETKIFPDIIVGLREGVAKARQQERGGSV